MPLPIVPATAVPNTNAAMKFQNAAHATARNGVSTRVDTTVAIEFAASCQPLENSNASVRKTTTIRSEKLDMGRRSGGLQDDAFDDVGDVFTFIDSSFDDFKNFLPLDDLHRIFLFIKKLRDQRAAQPIAFVFAAIDLDGVFQRSFRRAERVYARRNLFGGAHEYSHQVDRAFADRADAIQHKAARRGVDQIDHVIQPAAKFVNIFAIERRDEGLIQFGQDGVRDFVAVVFDRLDFLHLFGNASVMLQHSEQSLCAPNNIVGLLVEQMEKSLFSRKKAL